VAVAGIVDAKSGVLAANSSAIALYFMHYNIGRVHQMLRVTPAMEAGVSDSSATSSRGDIAAVQWNRQSSLAGFAGPVTYS
jgi:hypothetical protein